MLKDALPLNTIRRVLVIKLRHHGDVLLTSPVFSALKARLPADAEIDALVYADTAVMLSGHPAISRIHGIDRGSRQSGLWAYLRSEWATLRELRGRRYDLVIHLTDHPRGAWLVRACGARWAVTQGVGGRGFWWRGAFTHFFRAPRGSARHTVEMNLDALRRIGIYPDLDERRLSFAPGAEAEARVARLLADAGLADTPFIHIHPASRWHFKCWTADAMAQLVERLHSEGHRVVFTAAPDPREREMIEAIQARLSRSAQSFAGSLSLAELAALTARARLFIGVDSAPMHLAAAMATPVVALFGPSGDKEWGPWLVPHRVVSSRNHSCRPCGNDGCGGGKVSDCLTGLPVDEVHRAVQELLSK